MSKPVIPADFDHVYHMEYPGGYGYKISYPCRVIKTKDDRVKIDLVKNDGTIVSRWVKASSINPKGNPAAYSTIPDIGALPSGSLDDATRRGK